LWGDGINPITESLRQRQDRIRYIGVRHEGAAAFMATGYAKYTGKLGVCLATTGPGAVHLMNGLYDACMHGASVLAVTGSTFHDLIGTRYQQGIDTLALLNDIPPYTDANKHHNSSSRPGVDRYEPVALASDQFYPMQEFLAHMLSVRRVG